MNKKYLEITEIKFEWSLLHFAAFMGYTEMTTELLKFPEIQIQTTKEGLAPFHTCQLIVLPILFDVINKLLNSTAKAVDITKIVIQRQLSHILYISAAK